MLSVTKRIETVQQPKGGYLPTSLFPDMNMRMIMI